MPTGPLPVDEQLEALRTALTRNERLTEVLSRAADLDLPGWYLTAGCVFQTVWSVVIEAGDRVFGDLPVTVEIRNEARV